MDTVSKSEMTEVLNKLIKARLTNRAVFLFGHCSAAEEAADYLLSHGCKPIGILDNSVSKHGLSYRAIPVLPPDKIKTYNADNSIVLIASRFYDDMTAELKYLGYSGIIIKLAEYNTFTEYSLTDDTLKRKKERVKRGAAILERVRAEYPARYLVVCPYNALGDVYWAMAFLPAYRSKNGIGEAAVIVVGEACRQAAALFGVCDITALTQTEMDEFVQAIIFMRENNCIIAHHDRPYTDNSIKWLDRHFLSFIDFYRYIVYGLPKDTQPDTPGYTEPFDNRYNMPRGQSVIISAYAKSVSSPPADFWECIANGFLKQGYAVYTNTAGDETPVKGTIRLTVPISQIISAAEYAGNFIGIRNGLCDVLYTAKCRKTVVFPDYYYSTTQYKVEEFFELPNWKKIIT